MRANLLVWNRRRSAWNKCRSKDPEIRAEAIIDIHVHRDCGSDLHILRGLIPAHAARRYPRPRINGAI